MNLNLTLMYALCYDFVLHYPTQNELCKRLATFAAIESYSDLNTSNLSKTVQDIDKKYFYSLKWANHQTNPSELSCDYPAMIVLDKSMAISDVFSPKSKTCYTLEIAFLDKHQENCGDPSDICGNRSRHEIFRDTETFMMNFFEYLKGVVYLKTAGIYINDSVRIAQEIVETADPVGTRLFQKHINENNRQLYASRWEGGLDDLQGTFFEFKFCAENCGEFTWSGEDKSITVTADKSCCE